MNAVLGTHTTFSNKSTLNTNFIVFNLDPGALDPQLLRTLDSQPMCIICLERPVRIFQLPCSHAVTCHKCIDNPEYPKVNNVKMCTLCRANIDATYPLFFP